MWKGGYGAVISTHSHIRHRTKEATRRRRKGERLEFKPHSFSLFFPLSLRIQHSFHSHTVRRRRRKRTSLHAAPSSNQKKSFWPLSCGGQMISTSPWHLKKGENPPHTLSQTAGMQFFISKSIVFHPREALLLQPTVYLNLGENCYIYLFYAGNLGMSICPKKWLARPYI